MLRPICESKSACCVTIYSPLFYRCQSRLLFAQERLESQLSILRYPFYIGWHETHLWAAAWSVCLCVRYTGELCKTAERIGMQFGEDSFM